MSDAEGGCAVGSSQFGRIDGILSAAGMAAPSIRREWRLGATTTALPERVERPILNLPRFDAFLRLR